MNDEHNPDDAPNNSDLIEFCKDWAPGPKAISEYRQDFLNTAQRAVPDFGRSLRDSCLGKGACEWASDIQDWQERFNLKYSWAREAARRTLVNWTFNPELASSFQWIAAPAGGGMESLGRIFRCEIERHCPKTLDVASFRASIRAALDEKLDQFFAEVGGESVGDAPPKDFERAFRWTAMKVCAGAKQEDILADEDRRNPDRSQPVEWVTIWRNVKRACDLLGIEYPLEKRRF